MIYLDTSVALAQQGQQVAVATYDDRMAKAARRIGLDLFPL